MPSPPHRRPRGLGFAGETLTFPRQRSVGKCLVAALRHPEASFGKALKVQSFVVTPKQVLAEYEKQTGAKWAVSYLPLEKLRETEDRLWAEGSRAATSITLRRIWAEGGTLYDKNDNDLIGLAPEDMESLETAVRRAVQAGDGLSTPHIARVPSRPVAVERAAGGGKLALSMQSKAGT